jgi:hypothetical protein
METPQIPQELEKSVTDFFNLPLFDEVSEEHLDLLGLLSLKTRWELGMTLSNIVSYYNSLDPPNPGESLVQLRGWKTKQKYADFGRKLSNLGLAQYYYGSPDSGLKEDRIIITDIGRLYVETQDSILNPNKL